jgi:dimethylargininase
MIAITRQVSASINDCELSYIGRTPIDVARAREQHRAYVACLESLGATVETLPEVAGLPDAVFVEDTAVVLGTIAIATNPGAASRRHEVEAVAFALAGHVRVVRMTGGGTVDGGDVMHVGNTLYVGRTPRSSDEGIAELAALAAPHGVEVRPVRVDGCLHYKSGASFIGRGTVLANPAWVDVAELDGLHVIEVDPAEPWAANTVVVGDTVVVSDAFPVTAARLRAAGFAVVTLDISEFQKAEGGLSCLSILVGT